MGIEFGSERKEAGTRKISTFEAIDKIKEILEDSYMIKSHNKIYWKFWGFIEQIEKEL